MRILVHLSCFVDLVSGWYMESTKIAKHAGFHMGQPIGYFTRVIKCFRKYYLEVGMNISKYGNKAGMKKTQDDYPRSSP